MKLFIKLLPLIYLLSVVSCDTGHRDEDTHAHKEEIHTHSHEAETKAEAEAQQTTHNHSHTPYTLATVEKSDFNMIYKTSGLLSTDNKGISKLVAKTSGIVRFEKADIYPGSEIKKGELLFSIGGEDLIDNNTEAEYLKIRSAFEAARANFERASGLIEDRLITEEHFLQSKSSYERAKADYEKYRGGSTHLNSVTAPGRGHIDKVNITEGQMVKTGDILASIINTDRLILRADVPPGEFDIPGEISTANFSTTRSEEVYSLKDLDGRLISGGLSVENTGMYIPVYFSFANRDRLIPGSYADIWLVGKTLANVLTIPNTAIMEEYGRYYVFTENHDHEFEKRYIERGSTDGINTMVHKGLHEGETIVIRGTYQVKLSLMEGTVPDIHAGHSH